MRSFTKWFWTQRFVYVYKRIHARIKWNWTAPIYNGSIGSHCEQMKAYHNLFQLHFYYETSMENVASDLGQTSTEKIELRILNQTSLI